MIIIQNWPFILDRIHLIMITEKLNFDWKTAVFQRPNKKIQLILRYKVRLQISETIYPRASVEFPKGLIHYAFSEIWSRFIELFSTKGFLY